MYKIAEMSIDSASDPGYTKLSRILSKTYDGYEKLNLKEELKDINILSASDMELLPDNDFALIYTDADGNITRRYPRADLDNAIISGLYLLESYKSLPTLAAAIAAENLHNVISAPKFKYNGEIQSMLNCKLYDIIRRSPEARDKTNIYREARNTMEAQLRKGQLDEIEKIKTARAKVADSDFVFVTNKNGRTHRLFQIDTKENLQKHAEFFSENHSQFELEHRHQFAKKLRDKAAEMGTKIRGDIISKYASNSWSPTVDNAITARINALKDVRLIPNEKTGEYEAHLAGNKDSVAALVGYYKLQKIAGHTDIDAFAETLHKLDKLAGLHKAYGKIINDPYSSTYMKTAYIGIPYKDLATASTMFAGKKITENDIRALDIGMMGGVVDESTFEELQKEPIAVFNSLPIPYKSVILEAITAVNK